MVDSMFMVHAHGMGYDKLMTKISRDNDGYVPIDELQRRIELDDAEIARRYPALRATAATAGASA